MKIERISDNQIRCTLTRADFIDRHLKLSELAYGSEKAKSLFRDMMQMAAQDCGFEADDLPLMIEAIPASSDSLVLIITKVEDPEEFDHRFPKLGSFPDLGGAEISGRDLSSFKLEGADDILNLLGKVKESISALPKTETKEADKKEKEAPLAPKKFETRLFSFGTMDSVINASKLLKDIYCGTNTLYKDVAEDVFILAMNQSEHSANDFNRICNMLSEYGSQEASTGAILAYLEEHCDTIIAADAMQKLAEI